MKKLLILDLDETLIHATEYPQSDYDFVVGQYKVFKRAYLKEFLEFCSETFEVAIWTSSTENYAEEIVAEILPKGFKFAFMWSRNRCTPTKDYSSDEIIWVKDLKKVKRQGYALENIIVVDDSPEKLKKNYGNLIRIKPFFEESDDELFLLKNYLKTLVDVENIRSIEKRNWRR